MCAFLSPSFGAHLDCPPRPTEQWLYGWVDRYLNLSAMTITLPHTHAQAWTSDMPAFVCVCVLLKWHYIGWAISVIRKSVVSFRDFCFCTHVCDSKYPSLCLIQCLQFIILAWLSISCLSSFFPLRDLRFCFVFFFSFVFFSFTCLLNPFSTVWDLV